MNFRYTKTTMGCVRGNRSQASARSKTDVCWIYWEKKRLHIYKFIVCWILNLIQIDKCQEGRSWDWCAISNFTVISMLLLSCGSQQTTASMQNLYENIRNLDLVECWVICFNILTAKLANQVKQAKILLRKQRKFIELIAFLIGEQTDFCVRKKLSLSAALLMWYLNRLLLLAYELCMCTPCLQV